MLDDTQPSALSTAGDAAPAAPRRKAMTFVESHRAHCPKKNYGGGFELLVSAESDGELHGFNSVPHVSVFASLPPLAMNLPHMRADDARQLAAMLLAAADVADGKGGAQ